MTALLSDNNPGELLGEVERLDDGPQPDRYKRTPFVFRPFE
jgi:hypothetical protein